MTRLWFASMAAAMIGAYPALADAPAGPVTQITGWWLNPTPNNAWLRDGHTDYVVSEQGGESADGDWPEFPRVRFVRTNGSYGYGCTRMTAVVAGKRVVQIRSAAALPLKRCRASAALRKAEPSIK